VLNNKNKGMSLTIKGKIIKKLEIESGTSKAGNEWKKQSFVLNTNKEYNPEICFQLFGEEKMQMLNNLSEGDQVEVAFNLYSREYNGKYYHNLDAWRIEKIETTEDTNIAEEFPILDDEKSEKDDLPF
jgi:hypothetical protein